MDILVNDDFDILLKAPRVVDMGVHMGGGVFNLNGSRIGPVKFRDNFHIAGFHIVGV